MLCVSFFLQLNTKIVFVCWCVCVPERVISPTRELRRQEQVARRNQELQEQEHQLYAGWSAGDQQGQLTLVPSEAIQETRTGADGDALVVAPGRSVELTWSGELEAQRFDQIAVTLRAPTVVRPQLLLLDAKSRKLRSP